MNGCGKIWALKTRTNYRSIKKKKNALQNYLQRDKFIYMGQEIMEFNISKS